MSVQVECPTNAVSGEQRTTNALSPGGFIWDLAWEANTRIMCVLTSRLNFEHIRQRFLLFIGKIQNSVILLAKFRSYEKEKERARRYWSPDQYLHCLNKSKNK
jgi:hypothetical protein